MDQYIKNIREKFPGFKIAETGTPFEFDKHDHYIRDLMAAVPMKIELSVPNNAENENTEGTSENSTCSENQVQSPSDNSPKIPTELKPLRMVISDVRGNCQDFVRDLIPNDSNSSNSEVNENDSVNLMDGTNVNIEPDNDSMINDNNLGFISTTEDEIDSVNISDFNTSLKHFTKGFDHICKINASLEKRLRDSEKQYELKVKALDVTNTKLVEINALLKEYKNQNESLKKVHAQELAQLKDFNDELENKWQKLLKIQLRVANDGHDLELYRQRKKFTNKIINLEETMEKKDEAQKKSMDECKREYLQLIEEAKKNKYCMGCNNPKPLDIYLCSMKCL